MKSNRKIIDDILDLGFHPMNTRSGKIYHKSPFFCKVKDNSIDLYSEDQDTESLGKASNISELKNLMREYHNSIIQYLLSEVEILKNNINLLK